MDNLNWVKVESSNLDKVAYDGSNLYVQYKSGGQYQYEKVPRDVWESLIQTDSKGRFVNTTIKENYSYKRINNKELLVE